MRTLRIAAGLVLLYALLLLLNGLFYLYWSGDASEVARMLVRIVGSALVAYGLWIAARWGWWLGIIFTGVLSLFAGVALLGAVAGGMLEGRPYPTVDLLFFILSATALLLAFLLLVLPSSRRAVRTAAA